ncbi:DUF4136 domain-containing protein [Fibrivirga algicola]|uniref:DUF4136 domain-containing protein n=1 Tax=Fibrivirga algicola TaxID=2950420 RepID=A0ABX0QL69_9BACT|nr:DUF4136 domain-containing protein [Fibrivirga algicola]NID13226.1 DUF4136 domain-containing protein [Fibrivirga algicola]
MKRKGVWRQPVRGLAAAAIALSLGLGLSACSTSATDDLSPQDSNVIITNYDRQADFSQYATFSLPDSVLVESNDRYTQSSLPTEQRFVSRLATELTNRGFRRVAAGQPADLGVAVTRVNNRYTGVSVNPYAGYYSNYWGGFGGGFGGFYDPLYSPGYYQYYQVADQFWRIQIVDLKNRPITTPTTDPNAPQNQLRVLYMAEARGNGIFDDNAVDQLIADTFAQSTYLRPTR